MNEYKNCASAKKKGGRAVVTHEERLRSTGTGPRCWRRQRDATRTSSSPTRTTDDDDDDDDDVPSPCSVLPLFVAARRRLLCPLPPLRRSSHRYCGGGCDTAVTTTRPDALSQSISNPSWLLSLPPPPPPPPIAYLWPPPRNRLPPPKIRDANPPLPAPEAAASGFGIATTN